MRKPTMNDIAKHANVSQATVSRVINNHPNVKDEVRKRVKDSIIELNYSPNKAAQTLKNNNSKIIGVSLCDIYNPYFIDLIGEIEKQARSSGYSLLLHNCNFNPITEVENMDIFSSRQVDGIIYVPASDYSVQKIKSLNIPTVAVTMPVETIDSVSLDHQLGGALVAKHLLKQGHTRFCCLGQKTDIKFSGFIQELYLQGMNGDSVDFIEIKDDSVSRYQIRDDICKYFNSNAKFDFTAMFCFNDPAAYDFIQIATEHGIKVPGDIAVVGFDDTFIAKINKISSIHQPLEEMARLSIKIIMDELESPQVRESVNIKLSPSIIVRGSSSVSVTS